MASPTGYLAGVVLLAHAARGHGALLACDTQQASAWNTENSAVPNAFTAVAIDSLRATKQALDGAGVPFFLASGTLLGWHRNCMPIPWDNDVDVGVMIGDWTPGIVHSMEVAGFTHLSTVGTRSAGLTEVFEFERSGVRVRQDIHFYYTDAANDQVFTQLWEIDVSHRESWSPFALEPAEAFGLTVQVPADTELYLAEAYGDFMAKRTKSTLERDGGWNSITGPPNSGPGSLPMPAEGRRRRDASSCVTASYSMPNPYALLGGQWATIGGWDTDPNYNARDAHCNFQVGNRSQDETDEAKCQAKGCCTFYNSTVSCPQCASYSNCSPKKPGKSWDGDTGAVMPCNDQCKLFDPQDSFIKAAKEAAAKLRAAAPLCASSAADNTTVEASEAACQGKGCCTWSMGKYSEPIGAYKSKEGYCHYACEEREDSHRTADSLGIPGCKPTSTCAWDAATTATGKPTVAKNAADITTTAATTAADSNTTAATTAADSTTTETGRSNATTADATTVGTTTLAGLTTKATTTTEPDSSASSLAGRAVLIFVAAAAGFV